MELFIVFLFNMFLFLRHMLYLIKHGIAYFFTVFFKNIARRWSFNLDKLQLPNKLPIVLCLATYQEKIFPGGKMDFANPKKELKKGLLVYIPFLYCFINKEIKSTSIEASVVVLIE